MKDIIEKLNRISLTEALTPEEQKELDTLAAKFSKADMLSQDPDVAAALKDYQALKGQTTQGAQAASAKTTGGKYVFDPKVQEVQKKLIALGVDVGPTGADGKLGPNTAGGIRAFEKMAGLPETGKLSPELDAALAKGKAVEKGSDLGQSLAAIERIALKYKVENIYLIAADGTLLTEDAIDDIKGYATAGAVGGVASKLLSKSGKALPGVGTGLSAYDALERWKDGDRSGAVIAALAGVGWLIPGLGLVLGGGLDAYNMTRDKELTGSYFGGNENRALARKVDKVLGFTTESVSESQRIADLRDQLMQLENTEAVLSEGPLSALKAILSGGAKLAKGAAYGVKNPAAAATLKSVPGASKLQRATTGAARTGSAVMRNPAKSAAVGGVAAGAAGMSAMSGSPATNQSAQPGDDQAAASAQEIEQAVDQAEEQGIVIDPKDLEFLNTHLAVIKKYVDDPQLELPKDIQDRLLALTPKIQKLQAIAAAQKTEKDANAEPGEQGAELDAVKKNAGVGASAQPAANVTAKSPAVAKFKAVLANPELLKQFTPEEVAKLKELTDQIDDVKNVVPK